MERVRGFISMNYRFEMALWYHDIFYIPGSTINEQASADIAINDCLILGLKKELALYVGDLIRKKPVKKFYDSLLFHDIDFSILGKDEPTYAQYKQAIYWEYESFSDIKTGREKFLKELIKKQKIYYTEYFRDLYEKKARENIKAELQGVFRWVKLPALDAALNLPTYGTQGAVPIIPTDGVENVLYVITAGLLLK